MNKDCEDWVNEAMRLHDFSEDWRCFDCKLDLSIKPQLADLYKLMADGKLSLPKVKEQEQ